MTLAVKVQGFLLYIYKLLEGKTLIAHDKYWR